MNRRRPLLFASFVLAMAILAAAFAWLWPTPEVDAQPGMVIGAMTTPDGRVDLEIEVSRLDVAAEYFARISLPESGDVVMSPGVLGRFITDAEGTGSLATSSATTATGTLIPLTEELFAPRGRAISIVSASGEAVSEIVLVLPPRDE